MRVAHACGSASTWVCVPANTGVVPGTDQRKRGSSPGPAASMRMALAVCSLSSGTRCGLPKRSGVARVAGSSTSRQKAATSSGRQRGQRPKASSGRKAKNGQAIAR